MGTPDLARASLQALLAAPFISVRGVVTQPDRPKGRDLKLQAPPVKRLALEAGLPVLQPERAREPQFIESIRQFAPDLICVAAFGQILPKDLLEAPKFGCLNVHTSLLPKYRGAAPIQRAILNDETETGVTIMKMDVGLDTGDILTQKKTPIAPEDNAQTLRDRLAILGAELLVETIPAFVSGAIKPQPQPAEGVSYAAKIKKEEGHIDWTKPARVISNQLRGLFPWPGAFTHLQSGPKFQLLKIHQARLVDGNGIPGSILVADKSGIVIACGNQALSVQELQLEGGKKMKPDQFLAGHRFVPGQKFGAGNA